VGVDDVRLRRSLQDSLRKRDRRDGVAVVLFYGLCELLPLSVVLWYLHRRPPPIIRHRNQRINADEGGDVGSTAALIVPNNIDVDTSLPPWYGLPNDSTVVGFSSKQPKRRSARRSCFIVFHRVSSCLIVFHRVSSCFIVFHRLFRCVV
jgi:hypothetical protein